MTFDKVYSFFIESGFSESKATALANVTIEANESGKNLVETFYNVGIRVYGFSPQKASEYVNKFLLRIGVGQ